MARKSSAEVTKALLASQTQPVRLVVAASLVYHQITGKRQRIDTDESYRRALATTALAISQVADVYYVGPQNRLLRIPHEELAQGRFEDGGETLRTPAQTYAQLSVRRGDLMDAVQILQKAHEAITKAASRPQPPGRAVHRS